MKKKVQKKAIIKPTAVKPIKKVVKKVKLEDGKVIKDTGSKGKKDKGDEEEGTAVYKWWEEEEKEGGIKWSTLSHAGPLFPAVYVPHGIKMKYNGAEVVLTPACEEVASFFAALVGTDYATNKTFCKVRYNKLNSELFR